MPAAQRKRLQRRRDQTELEEIREVFDGDVIWGEDLMTLTVPVASTV